MNNEFVVEKKLVTITRSKTVYDLQSIINDYCGEEPLKTDNVGLKVNLESAQFGQSEQIKAVTNSIQNISAINMSGCDAGKMKKNILDKN